MLCMSKYGCPDLSVCDCRNASNDVLLAYAEQPATRRQEGRQEVEEIMGEVMPATAKRKKAATARVRKNLKGSVSGRIEQPKPPMPKQHQEKPGLESKVK